MNLLRLAVVLSTSVVMILPSSGETLRRVQQRTSDGTIEGVVSADGNVRAFKGIPFAAPPVGPLRWREPQPVTPWKGVREALEFGPRAMQGRIFDDMVFRDAGPSEDCLYLNVWLPEKAPKGKLPVMVWIYGGGFMAGAASEPRQDGSSLCQLGVIVVSMNYRLGIFGFLAHPELAAESGHNASGNYGLLDQIAALRWVRQNIGAFGGDPENVTIFGESAGSMSVCSLVASPLARGLFQKAIGESGALFNADHRMTLQAEAEKADQETLLTRLGTASLAQLRALPASALLDATLKEPRPWLRPVVDGYVLPVDALEIYRKGQQSRVPLLAGWNRDEGDAKAIFGEKQSTVENLAAFAREKYAARAEDFLKVYHAVTDADAKRTAADYGGDRFIAYSTWKWIELQSETSGQPVYRYEFDEPLPLAADAAPGTERTTPHASDIEFVFRALSARPVAWHPEAQGVSEMMAAYWTNFAKTGNPNGPGLPAWPRYDAAKGFSVMHLQAKATAAPDGHRDRYLFLESATAHQ